MSYKTVKVRAEFSACAKDEIEVDIGDETDPDVINDTVNDAVDEWVATAQFDYGGAKVLSVDWEVV